MSTRRRSGRAALHWVALVLAALLAVGLGVGRSLYLDAVTGADLPEDAAAAAALVGGIVLVALSRPTGASVLAIALIVLAVAALVEIVAASARPEPT